MPSYDITLEQITETLSLCLQSYSDKPESKTDNEWLHEELKNNLHDSSPEEINSSVREITNFHTNYIKNYTSKRKARSRGMGSEEWFARKLEEAVQEKSNYDTAAYFTRIDNAISEANDLTESIIRCKDGSINNGSNLHGFIAESEHVNSFNTNAALGDNQSLKAKVLRPAEGQMYGKNSVDIQIKKDGKVIRRYQAKYGKNKKSTEKLFEKGDYRGQRKLVPTGHETEGKSTSTIEASGIKSKPLSKKEAVELQRKAQEKASLLERTWDDFDSYDIAKHIGKRARNAALLGASIGGISSITQSILHDKKLEKNEIAARIMQSGATSGSNVAVSAGIKLMVEKRLLPKMSNTGIACSAVSAVNLVSTSYKLGIGEIDSEEAIDEIIDCGCSTYCSFIGAQTGATICSFVPIVGTVIGGVLGGFAGGTIGSAAAEGISTIAYKGRSLLKSAASTVSSIASGICNFVGGLFS